MILPSLMTDLFTIRVGNFFPWRDCTVASDAIPRQSWDAVYRASRKILQCEGNVAEDERGNLVAVNVRSSHCQGVALPSQFILYLSVHLISGALLPSAC